MKGASKPCLKCPADAHSLSGETPAELVRAAHHHPAGRIVDKHFIGAAGEKRDARIERDGWMLDARTFKAELGNLLDVREGCGFLGRWNLRRGFAEQDENSPGHSQRAMRHAKPGGIGTVHDHALIARRWPRANTTKVSPPKVSRPGSFGPLCLSRPAR